MHGLTPFTRKKYATAQRKFFHFFLKLKASFTPLGRVVPLMNGLCVCLQLF